MKSFLSILLLGFSLLSLNACTVVRGESSVAQYSNDTAITAKVKAQLVRSDEVSVTRVHVETTDGVVLLSGFVKTKAQMEAATRIASRVEGVKSVRNNLIL